MFRPSLVVKQTPEGELQCFPEEAKGLRFLHTLMVYEPPLEATPCEDVCVFVCMRE